MISSNQGSKKRTEAYLNIKKTKSQKLKYNHMKLYYKQKGITTYIKNIPIIKAKQYSEKRKKEKKNMQLKNYKLRQGVTRRKPH